MKRDRQCTSNIHHWKHNSFHVTRFLIHLATEILFLRLCWWNMWFGRTEGRLFRWWTVVFIQTRTICGINISAFFACLLSAQLHISCRLSVQYQRLLSIFGNKLGASPCYVCPGPSNWFISHSIIYFSSSLSLSLQAAKSAHFFGGWSRWRLARQRLFTRHSTGMLFNLPMHKK